MPKKEVAFDTSRPEALLAAVLTHAAVTLKLNATQRHETLEDADAFEQVSQLWLSFAELCASG